MDLDELLSAAAPPVTERTAELDRELATLIAAIEPARTPRRRARTALVGGAVAAVVGLGAAASASGRLPGWMLVETGSGQTCQVEVSARARTPGDGEPNNNPQVSDAERERTLVAAQDFLADFDSGGIDRAEAIGRWQAIETRIRAEQPDPAERQERLTGDDLEVTAVSSYLVDRLRTALAEQGLDIRVISVGVSTTGCRL